MKNRFKLLTRFIRDIGAAGIVHTGDKDYLAHVIGVYNDLKKWGCAEDLCNAGLFHSIYGTELFQRFALPLDQRGAVRDLIGERAERLAYWNCAMDRTSFDAAVAHSGGSHSFVDRIAGEPIHPVHQDFLDLMTLHLCDWLEQVPRSQQWNYRRAAYQSMANRLGGIALKSYHRVFSNQAPIS